MTFPIFCIATYSEYLILVNFKKISHSIKYVFNGYKFSNIFFVTEKVARVF